MRNRHVGGEATPWCATVSGDHERERRHDEQVQREVLAGMARILDVLHDISDSLRLLAPPDRTGPSDELQEAEDATLRLTVDEAAALLGLSPVSLRSAIAAGHGPPITLIGRRIFISRTDLRLWLKASRQEVPASEIPWRSAHLPGQIGARVPSAAARSERTSCSGSRTLNPPLHRASPVEQSVALVVITSSSIAMGF